MSSDRIFPIDENFNVDNLVHSLISIYQAKGYMVNAYPMGIGVVVNIEKNTDGINTIVGLCEGVRVNLIKNGNMLAVNYTEGKWIDKIIGYVLGSFTCGIIWIPTGIGTYRQVQLPSIISTDIMMLIGNNSY